MPGRGTEDKSSEVGAGLVFTGCSKGASVEEAEGRGVGEGVEEDG